MVYTPDLATAKSAHGSPAWEPDWDAPLICLYTSGSTGRPEPQFKSLGQLARGAQVLAARLEKDVAGGMAAIQRIVCSVPPQHMFGVETSVMLPLVTGLAVLEGRPLLPADVRSAFDSDAAGAAWIATPLHLRALAQADESIPNCRLVIASTMPLAPALAAQCEGLTRAPVLEIYGSTETGVVAMRRTARQANWSPVDGVDIVPTAQGSVVRGSHFPSPRGLADEVEVDEDGSFRLLGRHGDLIKIAGRRASLAGLNLLLQDVPGLADGVFYLPATGSDTERLVLIHAGPLDRAATLRWLRERMDPVFLPRTLIHVGRLPRNEVGKLPRAALDEIYRARPAKGGAA
jgi:acyl-coenzyme A synthetase/AMP-(fatty) acid ligase